MKTKKEMSTAVVSLTVLLAALFSLSCRAADNPSSQASHTSVVWDPVAFYKCPEWFRDAKFGIWAHWGPQSVPMMGDWYARNMYIEGNDQYKHHLETYGHPSEKGYKDIIPLWKAEKFDPDRLMALYKKAGARYFVSMGVHHDNFDLWNSTYNRWNAVKMGPQRDILGDWQKAAQKQGLYFGVSEHLAASFTWFQVSHGADKQGPKAGVPYDGNDPKYEDLYHFKAEPDDTAWYSNNPKWHEEWYKRIKDLVDQYKPDMLYTDGPIPFGQTGRILVGQYYDESAKRNSGVVQAVYTCKQKADGQWVEDLERGVKAAILPEPWQTDTSIGDWYYNKNWKFRDVNWTIHMLIDIVSKNGNLLLNVVQRPDGSLDPEVEQMLEKVVAWMAVNGDAIFATRPWLTFGEGAVKASGGNFKEDFAYSSQDIRYTCSKDGKVLNAFVLGWPGRSLILRSVQVEAAVPEAKVRMLGYDGKIEYTVNADKQLAISVPDMSEDKRPVGPAWTFQLTGFTVSLHPSAQ